MNKHELEERIEQVAREASSVFVAENAKAIKALIRDVLEHVKPEREQIGVHDQAYNHGRMNAIDELESKTSELGL